MSAVKLSHHQHAGAFLMVIIVKFVAAGIEWLQADDGLAVAIHNFFHMQAIALEFHCCCVEIFHAQLDLHFGRCVNLRGLEAVVFYADGHARRLLRRRGTAGSKKHEGKYGRCKKSLHIWDSSGSERDGNIQLRVMRTASSPSWPRTRQTQLGSCCETSRNDGNQWISGSGIGPSGARKSKSQPSSACPICSE